MLAVPVDTKVIDVKKEEDKTWSDSDVTLNSDRLSDFEKDDDDDDDDDFWCNKTLSVHMLFRSGSMESQ